MVSTSFLKNSLRFCKRVFFPMKYSSVYLRARYRKSSLHQDRSNPTPEISLRASEHALHRSKNEAPCIPSNDVMNASWLVLRSVLRNITALVVFSDCVFTTPSLRMNFLISSFTREREVLCSPSTRKLFSALISIVKIFLSFTSEVFIRSDH